MGKEEKREITTILKKEIKKDLGGGLSLLRVALGVGRAFEVRALPFNFSAILDHIQ